MVYPVITFHRRRITVVDGLPYYCSSGVNSGHPGVWFPFFMVVGSKQIKIPLSYDKKYQVEALNTLFLSSKVGYFVKYSTVLLNQPDVEDLCDGRLPTLNSIETSLALGSNLNAIMAFEKIKKRLDLSHIPVLELSNNAPFYDNADKVNEWLVQQGAVFASRTLTAELRPPLHWVRVYSELMDEFNQKKLPPDDTDIFLILKNLRDEVKYINRDLTCSILRKIPKEVALMGLYIAFWDIHEKLSAGVKSDMSYGECYSFWKNSGSFYDTGVTNYQLLVNQRSRERAVEFFSMEEPNSQQCLDYVDFLIKKHSIVADRESEQSAPRKSS